jgi:hypothetical protein
MSAFFIFRLGFTGAGGMGAMIWRVMFYEPSHLDGWTYMIPGTVGSLWLCIAGDSANSKALQTETFSCSQQRLNYVPEMRTKIDFCIHIVLNILICCLKKRQVRIQWFRLEPSLSNMWVASTSRTAIVHETAVQWT